MLKPVEDDNLTSGLARMKSRNDYIEFINRERPHGMMGLKFKSC